MKKLFYTLAACLFAIGFSACSDDNDVLTDTTLTHYVSFQLLGDEFVEVPIGTEYVDAGCKAELLGEDYTSKMQVEGLEDIDVNSPGLYYVTYSAVNHDGYTSSVTRTVAIVDPNVTTNIEGVYTVQEGSYRYWFSSGATVPFDGFDISITKAATGIFTISDMMGGYYDQRVGYGASYAMSGYISLDIENNISAISGFVPGWGDSYDDFYDGSYDPESKKIEYDIEYAGSMQFHIILKFKKSLNG